jgi:PhnB protein
MSINTYLFFDGRCEEALNFYKTTLGASIEFMMRNSESPEAPPADSPPMPANAVMHASFRIGDTMLMASDAPPSGDRPFKGFSLSISRATEEEARETFGALASGGKVDLPLSKTFWSPCFGMLTDKFGVSWMVGIDHKQDA